MSSLEERWQKVRNGISEAILSSGRKQGSVRLVAVSKFHPASAVSELFRLGQRDFGENYIQEARKKQDELAGLDIRWHAIGPVQTNKAKDMAGRFCLLHTLDRTDLARALLRRMPEGMVQETLVQINIGDEPQKSGIRPAEAAAFFDELAEYGLLSAEQSRIRIRGLMCLPPRCGEEEAARPYFAHLRKLRDSLEGRFGIELPELSMGMSGDYRAAIKEGATIVRIGTDIFGPRPAKI